MANGATPDPEAVRARWQRITALARVLSLALAIIALVFVWNHPRMQPMTALAIMAAYAAFSAVAYVVGRDHPRRRLIRRIHDVADALTVAAGAAISGGMESPMWLLLYPHVVSVSVRAGLGYGMVIGALDASLVLALVWLTRNDPLAALHAISMLFCAFMGGLTRSHLRRLEADLSRANDELSAKNAQLSATLEAREGAESRYRRLLERIQDGVVIIHDGRVVYANQVFAGMAGTTLEDVVGRDFRDLVPAEDRDELSLRYQSWQESQSVSGNLVSRLQSRAGPIITVSLRAGSVEFEGRRSIIATVRDITRERQMEQELQAHAGRLAAINEIANAINMSLAIDDVVRVAADRTRGLVPFDRFTVALAQGTEVEVLSPGTGALRSTRAIDLEAAGWAFAEPRLWNAGGGEPPPHAGELLAEPDVRSLATVPLRLRDRVIGSLNLGRLQPAPFSKLDLAVLEPVARHLAMALDNARLLEDVRRRGHEFETLLTIGRGIVERLELGELLPLITRSVNRVMSTHHCLLLLRHGDELQVAAQEGLEEEVVGAFRGMRVGESLSGWVIRERRPLSIPDMREDERLRYAAVVERYGYRSYLGVPLRRGDEVLGVLEVVTKHARRFSPEDEALMAAFADQAAVGLDNARLFEDARTHLDKTVEANRRLEELDQKRQEYLRNVSHEFRTPLTVIKGYAEFMSDSGDASARDSMRIIIESCDRLIDLVDTLIEVSRIEQESEDKILQVGSLDACEMVVSSVDGLRHAAEKKGIALEIEVPKDPCPMEGDAGLLHHVVRKLVDNALKYTPNKKRVLVTARAEDDTLELEVEDFGIGISNEHLPRIFEKFYMVDGGITRRVGGTGVGLYLVREIVRLHHGSISVRSEPGAGSTFVVRLPRRFALPRPQAALA